MTNVTVERRHATSAEDPPALSAGNEWMSRAARECLSPLLARAAALDPDDGPGWADLRSSAHATMSQLCAAALLLPHLQVGHGDPPVVVARTIAAAWRRAGMTL
jgi:hypothetical protein